MARTKGTHRSEEIERVVAYVFARKGYRSTTMRDIARELGMHQSSLYHYFKSKEDILFKLMMETLETGISELEKICDRNDPPEEKLNKVFRFHTQHHTRSGDRNILLENEMNSLSIGRRRIVTDRMRHYVNLIRSIIIDLFKKQAIKDIHPTIATFAFFGMVNYMNKWYTPNGPVKPDRLVHMFTKILTKGLYREG